MVECYRCGQQFEPSPDKLKAWGESERAFEPTDWECHECGDSDDPPDGDCARCCGTGTELEYDVIDEARQMVTEITCPDCGGSGYKPESEGE